MIRFLPLSTDTVRALQAGAPDANGQPAERHVSDGQGNPCRHCLQEIRGGAPMLVLSHRPFRGTGPYAETGPIFLCAIACAAWAGGVPPILASSPAYMLRAYCGQERILYGTGAIVPAGEIPATCTRLLADPRAGFVDIRSASNGCFQCRAVRA